MMTTLIIQLRWPQRFRALKTWYPERKVVVAFQSHTYSRTKQLFAQFVDAFAQAEQVVMIDIFPSAREAFDPSVSSDMLCAAINKKFPYHQAENLYTIQNLKEFLAQQKTGTVFSYSRAPAIFTKFTNNLNKLFFLNAFH